MLGLIKWECNTSLKGPVQGWNLHGAIASNAFISVINPAVSNQCLFCSSKETVFYIFIDCNRLTKVFILLTNVFNAFKLNFTTTVFINGTGCNNNKKKRECGNF